MVSTEKDVSRYIEQRKSYEQHEYIAALYIGCRISSDVGNVALNSKVKSRKFLHILCVAYGKIKFLAELVRDLRRNEFKYVGSKKKK